MKPERVIFHIDNTVEDQLKSGCRWNVIIDNLENKLNDYKKRDVYTENLSKSFIFKNWETLNWKLRMTCLLAIETSVRIDDVEWIKKNHHKFPHLGNISMYQLIKFRHKLKNGYGY
jgi:hypothetical protein